MANARIFILRDASIGRELVRFLKERAGPAANAGRPLQVLVSEHKPKRSNAANAFMWGGVLDQIARQAAPGGRYFDAECWHEQMKRDFLPETTALGVQKWRYLPDGSRELAMSTSDLNTEEMTAYLHQVQAYAATELGVTFDAEPS